MSNKPKITTYASLRRLAQKLRSDHSGVDVILLYAYNRTGKTRLSMEFKDAGKRKNNGNADTLYFNAFTEDLFTWENDLQGDTLRHLRLNPDSKFFNGLKDLALEVDITSYLKSYADFDFDIDYSAWKVSFRKGDTPFFHHVATLAELKLAADPASGKLYTFHFNALRSIMEKTASFFGHEDIGFCLKALDNEEDRVLYNRALNLLSHGRYAIHEPTEMGEDNKDLFRRILEDFTATFQFALPAILEEPSVVAPAQGSTP